MAVKKSKSKRSRKPKKVAEPEVVEEKPLEEVVLDKAEEAIKEELKEVEPVPEPVAEVCEIKVDPVYVAVRDINLKVRKGDIVSSDKIKLWESQGRDLSSMVKLKE